MAILFKTILVLHIAGGTIGLISGTINILGAKGGKVHRMVGKIFLYSMLVVSFSAFLLSVIHPNYFLFIVGVFTLYMVSTGTRYLDMKQLGKGHQVKLVDWLLVYFMLIFGLLFIGFGIYHLLNKQTFGIVFIVFGFIGLRMVKTDFSNFRGRPHAENTWLLVHIQRMIGSYIAALTAFLVVNNEILPPVIAWLLPSVLFVPLIFKWSRKYKINRIG